MRRQRQRGKATAAMGANSKSNAKMVAARVCVRIRPRTDDERARGDSVTMAPHGRDHKGIQVGVGRSR